MGVWQPGTVTLPAPDLTRDRRPPGLVAARVALVVLLAVNGPLHVCMPLASDAVLYDLQARTVLEGGVLYRDIFETNLPGIVWIHIAIRSAFGWSSEALRIVDLAVFAGVVWLLCSMLRCAGLSASGRAAAACAMWWCYLSVSEWCHCQRDTWMLLPALAAFRLRLDQCDRLRESVSGQSAVFKWSFAEGLLWAAAFWIKPFVAVPALACFAVSAWQAGGTRRVLVDGAGVLCGGLLLGAAGALWLHGSGAWPYFLETFLEWNPDYVAGGRARWTLERIYGIGYRLFPWILVHAAALPMAFVVMGGWGRSTNGGTSTLQAPSCNRRRLLSGPEDAPDVRSSDSAGAWRTRLQPAVVTRRSGFPCTSVEARTAAAIPTRAAAALLAAMYVGWLVQAVLLQQPFDYIQVPPMLLGLAVIAAAGSRLWSREIVRSVAVAFACVAAITSPALKFDRIAGWSDCLTRGSTSEVRDRLAYLRTPNYAALADVERFLRSQHVRDGELTCFHVHLIHLYSQLGVRPATRYVGLEALRRLFPRHRAEIDETVAASRQRFVVTDLVEAGLSVAASEQVDSGQPPGLPPALLRELRDEFPWNLPVVFRSGRYVVHAAAAPLRQ